MARAQPYDADQAVNEFIATGRDPGKGGKLPLPENHSAECAGDSCWCKHY